MKFRGGLNVPISGEASRTIRMLPIADRLYLPLFSRRLRFSQILVEENQYVQKGQLLAVAPDQYDIPLFAPECGVVRLSEVNEHIVLDKQASGIPVKKAVRNQSIHSDSPLVSSNMMTHIGSVDYSVADPSLQPDQYLVAGFTTEPCYTNASVIEPDESSLRAGLLKLISLSKNHTINIALSRKWKTFNSVITKVVQKIDGVKLHMIPHKYPFDNPAFLISQIGLSISGTRYCKLQDVSALGYFILKGEIDFSRIIAVAGPGAITPQHVSVVTGYPLGLLLKEFGASPHVKILNGGVFSGTEFLQNQKGIDVECSCITIIPKPAKREFISFARPGLTSYSYTRSFLGSLRINMKEQSTTSLRGEHRPCIACSFCEDVCPVGILPSQINRYISSNMLEHAQRLKIESCIACGLCSYVCPSKIEVSSNIAEGIQRLQHVSEAEDAMKEGIKINICTEELAK